MVHAGVGLLGQVDLLGLVLCQFHEKEKFAKFIMLTLNLEFVVYFEKSSFSWYVQLKAIYY